MIEEIYYRFDMKVSEQIVHNIDMDDFQKKFKRKCNNMFDGNVPKNISFILKNPEICHEYSKLLGLDVCTFIEFMVYLAPRVFNKRMISFIHENYDLKKV